MEGQKKEVSMAKIVDMTTVQMTGVSIKTNLSVHFSKNVYPNTFFIMIVK